MSARSDRTGASTRQRLLCQRPAPPHVQARLGAAARASTWPLLSARCIVAPSFPLHPPLLLCSRLQRHRGKQRKPNQCPFKRSLQSWDPRSMNSLVA